MLDARKLNERFAIATAGLDGDTRPVCDLVYGLASRLRQTQWRLRSAEAHFEGQATAMLHRLIALKARMAADQRKLDAVRQLGAETDQRVLALREEVLRLSESRNAGGGAAAAAANEG
jgi:hypothetical protein